MGELTPYVYTRLISAKLFIDSHVNETIDLDQIAAHACMSPFHFHRLFSRVYRITPHQYLTRKRIQKAKELLQKGELAISAVCMEVGFESQTSFSALFKKMQGTPPALFRQLAHAKQQRAAEQPLTVIPACFLPWK